MKDDDKQLKVQHQPHQKATHELATQKYTHNRFMFMIIEVDVVYISVIEVDVAFKD